jgi:hypothetical protein
MSVLILHVFANDARLGMIEKTGKYWSLKLSARTSREWSRRRGLRTSSEARF